MIVDDDNGEADPQPSEALPEPIAQQADDQVREGQEARDSAPWSLWGGARPPLLALGIALFSASIGGRR